MFARATWILIPLDSNLRKVKILLDAFERAEKPVKYYALDLSKSELERTLLGIPSAYRFVECFGLLGTYDEGLLWLQAHENAEKRKCVLWLGSSIGNFPKEEAAVFLRKVADCLTDDDVCIVGIDACQDEQRVLQAYNDRHGKTHDFVRNGLDHANDLLGKHAFDQSIWNVVGEYDRPYGRHLAFLYPDADVLIEDVIVRAGERIQIEESNKYSASQARDLWQAAGLKRSSVYGNDSNDYREFVSTCPTHMLRWSGSVFIHREAASSEEKGRSVHAISLLLIVPEMAPRLPLLMN